VFVTPAEEPVCYQSKFRTGRPSLTWTELSTYYGLADVGSRRLVFTNCDEIACVAEDRLGAIFVRGSDLDRLAPEDFQIIEAWLAERPATAKRKDPKPHPFPFSLLAALAVLALNFAVGIRSTHAALANDNFTLSVGSNATTVNSTESAGVGQYMVIQGAGLNMNVVDGSTLTPAFGSGNVLALGNSTSTNTFFRAFNGASTFSLNSLATNETLDLSFDITFDGATLAAAQNLSFGLVNYSSPVSIIYANVDLSSAALASEFRYRTGSYNMSSAGPTVGTAWTESPTVLTNTSYRFDFAVTKDGGGNFIVAYSRNGTTVSSQTLLSNSTWGTTMAGLNIQGVAFRQCTTPGVFTYIDNVLVTVPEPTTVALSLAAGAGLLLFLRRRKHEQ